MKKLITLMVCIGLLTNSLAAITPLRVWQCRPSKPNKNCSRAEQETAENFFRNAKIGAFGVLAAALAGLGIIVGIESLRHEQDEALAEKPLTAMELAAQQGKEAKELLKQQDYEEPLSQARRQFMQASRDEISKIKASIRSVEEQLRQPGLTHEQRQQLHTQKDKFEVLLKQAQNRWIEFQKSN